MTNENLPVLLNTDDLAAYLEIPARTIEGWRRTADGPPFVRLGKHVRYPQDEFIDWVRKQMSH